MVLVPRAVGLDDIEAATLPLVPLVPDGQHELRGHLLAVAGGGRPMIQSVCVPMLHSVEVGDRVETLRELGDACGFGAFGMFHVAFLRR